MAIKAQYLLILVHRDSDIAPSVGSRRDSFDNVLAESVIGLFKTEVIDDRDRGARSRQRNSPR